MGDEKKLLIRAALRELRKLERKKVSLETIERFMEVVRIFLNERFHLKRSLTIQEVLDELPKKKIHKKEIVPWIKFLFKLSDLDYNNQTLPSKKDLKDIMKEAEELFYLS